MTDIKNNLARIHREIGQICHQHQRSADEVTLLAVSKTKPAADIEAAFAAGQKDFGENYLQEALEKIGQLRHLDIHWHFIGSIQGNKTRAIAENFDWVHTLSSHRHASRINAQRPDHLPPINACIQVNISQEDSKGGIAADDLTALAEDIISMPRIHLRGLMVIPAPTDDRHQQLQLFHRAAALKTMLEARHMPLDTLSMGMSSDYPAAIAEGATIIRIGTAIFGRRERKP